MATKAQLEVLVGEQQEYIDELEAAVMVFSGFRPHLRAAEIQRRAAVDIGVVADRLRTVVDLCDKIHEREDAEALDGALGEHAKGIEEAEASDDVEV